MTKALNPLAAQAAGPLELESCADDYDVRAEAVEHVGQNGDGWRLRAARLRVLATELRRPIFAVTTDTGSRLVKRPITPEESVQYRLGCFNNSERRADHRCMACDNGFIYTVSAASAGREAGK